MDEYQVREYIRKLRRFYTDLFIYAIINFGLILIWAVSDANYFWPKWVLIGSGIGLCIHAFSLGLIPQMNIMIPFMSAEWEDQQVQRLIEANKKGQKNNQKEILKNIKSKEQKIKGSSLSTTSAPVLKVSDRKSRNLKKKEA